MQQWLSWSGNGAALLGIVCCVVAALSRISGYYYLPGGGVEAMSVFNLGMGLMIYGCLTKLELLLRTKS